MLVSIVAASLMADLTGDKPEILIAVAGTVAVIFNIRRNFQKTELEIIYNGWKFPEWAMLLIAAIYSLIFIIPISLFFSLMFRTNIVSQLIFIAPMMALFDNRKISRRKILVPATEIIFQLVLIIQFIAIVAITKGTITFAIASLPFSFFFCLYAYRIEERIQKKIEEQTNARQDQS